MKTVTYIATGRSLPAAHQMIHDEYKQRLGRWYELKEVILQPSGLKDAAEARNAESENMLQHLQENDFVVLLDERGRQFNSKELSKRFTNWSGLGQRLVFVIGGAYGVNEHLRSRAQVVWSLSSLVFTHELVRVLLLEQLYRSAAIAKNLPYHHS